MTKRIVFYVTDELAAEMKHHSVYLDVFGNVRWVGTGDCAAGATGWQTYDVEEPSL